MLKYFDNKLSSGFVALFSGKMIQFAAAGLIGLFLPMFLLTKLNYRLEYVLFYYIIGYALYGLFLPLGARFLNKIGLRRSLRISVFLDALFYVCFFFYDKAPLFFLVMSAVVMLFARFLFWLPFHTDLAKFTDRANRGREIGLFDAARSFLAILMPFIAGFIIFRYGFNIVFVMAIILYLVSIIPFLALPRTMERFSWGIRQTFQEFFSSKNRKMVFSNMGNGAENAVEIIIWPIFIWQLLKGNYFNVGAISSIIVLVAVVLQLLVGKYTDLFNKRKMLHWGSAMYSFGWVVKIYVLTTFQVFAAGAYHEFAKIFKDTPFDALNYELLADCGHYVDEFTVIKEMAVQSGRILILLLALVIIFYFGINWTFALAALATLMINLL